MKVSRSAYFAWRHRESQTGRTADAGAWLAGRHPPTHQGLHARNPTATPSDDLVHRQFRPDGPNRWWVQDITQHRTSEGWVYLAVVIDAWSRRVVGWSIADYLRLELVVDALEVARLRRRPEATVVHPDHGWSIHVVGVRTAPPCRPTDGFDGNVGDALDNAVAESFFPNCNATPRPPPLAHPCRNRPGDVSLDRCVLQPDPPSLYVGLPQPARLRDRRRGMITTTTRP